MTNNPAKNRFLRLLALVRTGDYAAAAKGAAAALRIAPKDPNLLHLSAQIAEALDESDRAIMFYRRALAIKPDWFEATFNMAALLGTRNNYTEAIAFMTKAAQVRPGLTQPRVALAKFHQAAGDLPAAKTAWEKALALEPDNAENRGQYFLVTRQMCDWSVPLTGLESLPPQAATVLCDDPVARKAAAERYVQQRFRSIRPFTPPDGPAHDRLRVGYLSADFHAHATAYLLAELFSLHDREKFDVFAYSYGVDDRSPIRARLKEQAEHFVELNRLSAEQAATRIRQDDIDILIDLKGHTRGARLDIVAYRPARVQAHWLGYPGTSGAAFIDFFIGDAITIPDGDEKFFTERILRLPHCYQINDRQRMIAEPLPRTAYGLPETGFVLASFNQTYKITPQVFALWCGLLREFPESVLWLYQSNLYAPENLRRAAQEHSIDPARLLFAPPLPLDQHLARYAHVDLALDTHPVGGHTTTSDALWAGVPVITMKGQSFVSRVAASILTAAGLPQLVTDSPKDYTALAAALLRDKPALLRLKENLRTDSTSLPLFDTPRFVRDWETLLNVMSHKPK